MGSQRVKEPSRIYSSPCARYETYDVLVKDLATGRVAGDVLRETAGEVVWGRGSDELYYTTMDPEHRPCKCAARTISRSRERRKSRTQTGRELGPNPI